MRTFFILILISLLLSGCAPGNFAVNEGSAKFSIPFDWPQSQNKEVASQLGAVYIGMSKSDLYEKFAEFLQRNYRRQGNQEWITFHNWATNQPKDAVTFYLLDGKVKGWKEQ